MKRFALLLVPALLAGCGKIAPLMPPTGQPLPIKPASSPTTPTAEQLLQPRTDASPQRVDELIRRSQPRRADRFDLPPPDGGAPPLPAGAPPAPTSSEQAGPATPQ